MSIPSSPIHTNDRGRPETMRMRPADFASSRDLEADYPIAYLLKRMCRAVASKAVSILRKEADWRIQVSIRPVSRDGAHPLVCSHQATAKRRPELPVLQLYKETRREQLARP